MKVSKVSKFASFGKIDGSMLSFGAAEGGEGREGRRDGGKRPEVGIYKIKSETFML